jgi:hypothetical protein
MERRKTPTGREFDAWTLDGIQVGTLGAVIQAGQRFEDPSQIDFLGTWEDVRKGAYDAHSMIVENEEDGVWGSVLQPSQGLFWYRIRDGKLLSEICRVYNDWIVDFCRRFTFFLRCLGCHASWRFPRMVVYRSTLRSQASVALSTLVQDCRSASEPETVSTGCYEPVQDAPSARSAALLDQAGSRSDLLLVRRAENRC